MTRYAFDALPDQLEFIQNAIPEITALRTFGIDERWDMPYSILACPTGFDATYPDTGHVTISLVHSGGAVERMDGRFAGRRAEARRDMFMLYPGHGSRRWRAETATEIRQFYLTFDMIANVASEISRNGGQGFELRDDRVIARDASLRLMVDLYTTQTPQDEVPPSTLEMDARAVLTAAHLVRRHSNRTEPAGRCPGALSPVLLNIATEYLDANLERNLPLAELAAAVGLSPHYFCTAFARSTGQTPHSFLLMRRIERARQLLIGDMPLAQVALACGFSSQSHFTTVFRKLTNTTPAAWRTAHRR